MLRSCGRLGRRPLRGAARPCSPPPGAEQERNHSGAADQYLTKPDRLAILKSLWVHSLCNSLHALALSMLQRRAVLLLLEAHPLEQPVWDEKSPRDRVRFFRKIFYAFQKISRASRPGLCRT